ncbi:MAG: T9SS type A sorting domain-containing protein [Bacteroidales bacterium]
MKTKQVLCLTLVLLLAVGWQASVGAQDIPANYVQNPNMEHELNAIFWYGSCCDANGWNGIANYPTRYISDADAHSGNSSFTLPAGSYVWVSYPVRGQEEKKMKASFWYRGSFSSYWNFIYRDVGMTYEDLHPLLAEYVGADSAVWGGEGQDAMQFLFGGEDDWTEDWTYFEFVWDMPGTIPGWGNTTMWWAWYEPAYLDDFYYGEWYDGQYSGEEPFDFINGDFEASELNVEWLLNVASWDDFGKDAYLSWTENKTEAGLQSLRLQNYNQVTIDTIDMVDPVEADSILENTSLVERNVTYYLPAMGAEDENMEMSFWYKGNSAKLALDFYDDYGVSTDEFPLPAGAMLYADSANPMYEIDTISMTIDTLSTYIDTFTVADRGAYTNILELQIDTLMLQADEVLAWQDFDDASDLKLTAGAWVWSGSNNYEYDDWAAATKDDESWSDPESLWMPGDPNWGGAEGYVNVMDDTHYIWEFWYIGQVQFILNLGMAKYDLVGDPEGIVPSDATADAASITWMLDSKYWKRFRYEYKQGSWLADASAVSPANISFNIIGTYDAADLGYVDDFMVATGAPMDPVIDTSFVVIDKQYDIEITYEIDTLNTTYNPAGAMWELPAQADWTNWILKWTNPGGDIGGTLTLLIEAVTTASPDIIIPLEKEEFDDEHAGWSYFDDFVYRIAEPEGINRDLAKYDLHTYPNPASDVINLSIQIPLDRVDIFNSLGQLQMSLDHPGRVLNIGQLQDGIYFINASDEMGVVHKAKFIKR